MAGLSEEWGVRAINRGTAVVTKCSGRRGEGGELHRYSVYRREKDETSQGRGEKGAPCHRYFPFVCDELDVDGADGAPPRLLAPALSRGFLDADVPSADGARGPSFVIIFAWISSSFAALTFLGQNSVTNL